MTIKVPSLLNYTRSIVPSEGVFWAVGTDGSRRPILVEEKTVLGTIANFQKKAANEKDADKLAEAGDNNIQTIDACSLPPDCNAFEFEFNLKFLSNSASPGVCNDLEVAEMLSKFSETYGEKGGYESLAEMYLANLLNGRFLWRNRYGKKRTITLSAPYEDHLVEQTEEIVDHMAPTLPQETAARLSGWTEAIAGALSGKRDFFLMNVTAHVEAGRGQEIYPSQEFVQSGRSKSGGDKSKTLFSVNVDTKGTRSAAMHSQKIGNAIRTIDIWHAGENKDRALAVDPYAVDKRIGAVVRHPSKGKTDFYSLMTNLPGLTEKLAQVSDKTDISGEAHYLIANLIRGGVFSGEKKK